MEVTVTSPKNTVFQLRINKEVKDAAEELFSRCGLTLSDALNLFIQQSLNRGGIPFEISGNQQSMISKEQAVSILISQLDAATIPSKRTTYSTDDLRERYGV